MCSGEPIVSILHADFDRRPLWSLLGTPLGGKMFPTSWLFGMTNSGCLTMLRAFSYLTFFSGQICLELPWVIPPQIVIMVGTLRLRGVNIRNNHVSYPGDDLGEGISLEGITFCRPPGWLWSEAIHRVFDNHRYTQSGYTRICWVGTVYEHVWLGLVGFMSIITIAITCYNCSLVGL